jgi:hypothetical protein
MTQDGPVLSVDLAQQLHRAGLVWTPARGDRFVIPGRDMDDEVFVLSDMTIEVHRFPTGPVIGFNGTTEWALDSLDQRDALWIPAEDQLRERLGDSFAGLGRQGGRYVVSMRVGDGEVPVEGDDPADAYGRALLYLLRQDRSRP